ncbi:uncharacterized protein KY384_002941 [Bacidia gigantensis]|uniref:uncharacterized protein n=1 Tax=Bacidia gigantensis TaxID=2732470 RepID=UPI001D04AC28|nr:uncharacterized protein KY384_002941 [Bacidia gigantensis]KAG8531313.1 hypothetical protein KY384_002941 [Bacidia gigantensis]
MHHTSFAFLSSLVLATLTSEAPVAEPQAQVAPSTTQEPLQDYTPHQQTPQDVVTIDSLGFHGSASNPHNSTCNATDTACVTGVQPASASKRDSELQPTRITEEAAPEAEFVFTREAAPEEAHERRQSSTLQQATDALGITELRNSTNPVSNANTTTTPQPSNNHPAPGGVCRASDVSCVVGKVKGKFVRDLMSRFQ